MEPGSRRSVNGGDNLDADGEALPASGASNVSGGRGANNGSAGLPERSPRGSATKGVRTPRGTKERHRAAEENVASPGSRAGSGSKGDGKSDTMLCEKKEKSDENGAGRSSLGGQSSKRETHGTMDAPPTSGMTSGATGKSKGFGSEGSRGSVAGKGLRKELTVQVNMLSSEEPTPTPTPTPQVGHPKSFDGGAKATRQARQLAGASLLVSGVEGSTTPQAGVLVHEIMPLIQAEQKKEKAGQLAPGPCTMSPERRGERERTKRVLHVAQHPEPKHQPKKKKPALPPTPSSTKSAITTSSAASTYKGDPTAPCEGCGCAHDHSYGSGRFCSRACRSRCNGRKMVSMADKVRKPRERSASPRPAKKPRTMKVESPATSGKSGSAGARGSSGAAAKVTKVNIFTPQIMSGKRFFHPLSPVACLP